MKRLVPILTALLLLPSCAPSPSEPEVEPPRVENVWIRRPALSGRPGAAYFTFHGGGEAVRLKGISTHAARRVELHDSRMEGGVMRMTTLREIEIPAGATVAFEPGGRHAMLFEMSDRIMMDDRPTLVFRFTNGNNVTAEAHVLAPNDPPPRFVRQPRVEGRSCPEGAVRKSYEVTITTCTR